MSNAVGNVLDGLSDAGLEVARGRRPAAAHRRDAGVPDHRAELQAPAHLRRAAQRAVRPAAGRARRGQAADVRRQAGHPRRHRGPRRGRHARRRRDRGLHLEGHARLRDLHRVRPLPVAVPGLEHREAAVAQAADHGPARPRVRQGAVPPGRRGEREPRCRPRPGRGASGRWSAPPRASRGSPSGGAVIDPDVLWSCTSCGACVQQCPVDIEHVDHIIDMRRYQVLVESNFPAELNQLFKGLENKGNPWNMSRHRADGLGQGPATSRSRSSARTSSRSTRSTGCSGSAAPAPTRTAPRRPRGPSPSCSTWPASRFGVLGNGETCTGDPARRAGNEFVFQGLAQQNVETFKEDKVKKVVSTCAHCFNTLKNEYKRVRRRARGRAPHPAAQPARPRGQADPGRRTAPAPRSARSPTTTRATSAATTRSTRRRASCSRCCPAPSSSRWSATPSGPSAAAPAARGCGWRRTSASGSTRTAPPRPSAPAPTRSPSAARSAG